MNALVTLTPSAAIDHTYVLPSLVIDRVNRAVSTHTELSGKGLNVAQAASLADVEVRAVLQLHATDKDLAVRSPAHSSIRSVAARSSTRINTTIIHDQDHTTKVNQTPVILTPTEWNELCQETKDQATRLGASWMVISGSIPTLTTGEPVDITELLKWSQAQGIKTALDTSGPALESALNHGVPITLIKPNTHELSEHIGRPLRTIGDVVEAATELLAGNLEIVYVSMGADGALCVTKDNVLLAKAIASRVANTAGAGDASLAGFVTGYIDAKKPDHIPTSEALEHAIIRAASWGALAVSLETTMVLSIDAAPTASLQRNPAPETPLADPALE